MAKAKNFDFELIKENGLSIIAENGIECKNSVSLPMIDDENGEEIGQATAIYDGLAVICAVNEEIFAQATSKQKQVIAEKFLMLKPASVIEIDGKKYKVCEVKEFGGGFVALIQAA